MDFFVVKPANPNDIFLQKRVVSLHEGVVSWLSNAKRKLPNPKMFAASVMSLDDEAAGLAVDFRAPGDWNSIAGDYSHTRKRFRGCATLRV
jgi:hypothetical protein